MAQTYDLALSAQDVQRRFRRRRRALGESMPRPVLIHRPTADERAIHGASGSQFEALAVLKRALEEGAAMASLRRVFAWGKPQAMSDLEVLERLAREVASGRMIIYSRPPPTKPSDERYAAAYDEDYRALLAGPFVGAVPHMYLHGRGLVSVGVSASLPTPAAALLVKFVHRNGKKVATPAAVTAAYLKVKASIANRAAASYRGLTDLDLAPGESDRLLNLELERAENGCRKLFGGWERFPLPAQLALLDMVYDLGEGRAITPAERQAGQREQGLYQFGKLREAVAKQDWAAASRACHRKDTLELRDTWTRDNFLEAAHLAPPRPDPHRALML